MAHPAMASFWVAWLRVRKKALQMGTMTKLSKYCADLCDGMKSKNVNTIKVAQWHHFILNHVTNLFHGSGEILKPLFAEPPGWEHNLNRNKGICQIHRHGCFPMPLKIYNLFWSQIPHQPRSPILVPSRTQLRTDLLIIKIFPYQMGQTQIKSIQLVTYQRTHQIGQVSAQMKATCRYFIERVALWIINGYYSLFSCWQRYGCLMFLSRSVGYDCRTSSLKGLFINIRAGCFCSDSLTAPRSAYSSIQTMEPAGANTWKKSVLFIWASILPFASHEVLASSKVAGFRERKKVLDSGTTVKLRISPCEQKRGTEMMETRRTENANSRKVMLKMYKVNWWAKTAVWSETAWSSNHERNWNQCLKRNICGCDAFWAN